MSKPKIIPKCSSPTGKHRMKCICCGAELDFDLPAIHDAAAYIRLLASKGGKRSTKRKREASRASLAKARSKLKAYWEGKRLEKAQKELREQSGSK